MQLEFVTHAVRQTLNVRVAAHAVEGIAVLQGVPAGAHEAQIVAHLVLVQPMQSDRGGHASLWASRLLLCQICRSGVGPPPSPPPRGKITTLCGGL